MLMDAWHGVPSTTYIKVNIRITLQLREAAKKGGGKGVKAGPLRKKNFFEALKLDKKNPTTTKLEGGLSGRTTSAGIFSRLHLETDI